MPLSSRPSHSSGSHIQTGGRHGAGGTGRGNDHVHLELATSTPAEVAAVGGARWFQLYVFRDEGVKRELIVQARRTVPRPRPDRRRAGGGSRERDCAPAFGSRPR